MIGKLETVKGSGRDTGDSGPAFDTRGPGFALYLVYK